MKSRIRILIPQVLVILWCILPACSTSKTKQTDLDSLTTEALFSEDSQYRYLHQLFGDMSSRDLFDLSDKMMLNMVAAMRAGDATAEDFRDLKKIMRNIHDWMAAWETEDDPDHTPGVQILRMMIEHNVGDLMTRSIYAAGGDILTNNVFPMMTYVMACDDQVVQDAVDGITIDDLGFNTGILKEGDFKDMMSVVHGFLDTENPEYKDIRKKWDALDAAIDNATLDVTVGDLKDILPDMDIDDLDTLPVLIDVAHAIHQLYDEDPKIKEDIDKLLYATGYLMNTPKPADGHNKDWDTRTMTDSERILFCLEDILKPERRGALKEFVRKALNAVHCIKAPKPEVGKPDGPDNIYMAMEILDSLAAQRDPYSNTIQDLDDLDYGIYRCALQLNQLEEPTETHSIKMSQLETTILLFDVMCRLSDLLQGPASQALLGIIKLDPEGPACDTRNSILEFMIGWWGQSCYRYPRSYHNTFTVPGRTAGFMPVYPDTLQGQDWYFYKNAFKVKEPLTGLLIPLPDVNFLIDLITIPNSFNYLLGVLAETLDSITSVSGGTGKIATTGQHHKMFKLIAPALKWYYEAGYPAELIHAALEIDEIDPLTYKPIAYWPNGATLHEDRYQTNAMTSLETIQGPYGYGLLYYTLRGASDARWDNEADLGDPALDLAVRIANKFVTTRYGDGNLAKAFCDMVTEEEPEDPEDLGNPDKNPYDYDTQFEDWRDWNADHLFKADGAIENLYTFIHDNHAHLARVAAALGDVMLAAFNPKDPHEDILYTDDIVSLLRKSVLPKLGSGLQDNRDAVRAMVVNGLNQTDTDPEVIAAAGDFAAAVCEKGERIFDDIARAVPALKQIHDATINDYTYDPANSRMQPFIDYLTQEVNGRENPFIFNLKSLGYKLAGIYDETYNTRANAMDITDDTPLMDVVDHLVGDDTGLYDTTPLKDFLRDVTDDKGNGHGDVLWQLIDGGQPWDATAKHFLEKILGDDLDDRNSWNFIRSLCLSYNGNDPVMLMILKTIHLEYHGQPIEITGVMNDICAIIDNYDFQPGTRLYIAVFDALSVLVNSW